MRILVTSSLFVLLLAGLLNAQQIKGPRIAVKETRYDAGSVVQGTQVSHVFEVRNEGTETLVIERVQPG